MEKNKSKKKKVVEEEKKVYPDKNTEKEQQKILKNILIVTGIIIILVLASYLYINSLKSYNYNGVDFNTVSEGDLILYQTYLPVPYQGKVVPYNIYFRTKPSKLKHIPFDTEGFTLMKNAALNVKTNFDCEGYQSVALGNVGVVHNVGGINLVQDENATCDPQGRYMMITIQEGDKSEIIKEGENCYTLNVNNCEILPVTERFLAEILVKLNE